MGLKYDFFKKDLYSYLVKEHAGGNSDSKSIPLSPGAAAAQTSKCLVTGLAYLEQTSLGLNHPLGTTPLVLTVLTDCIGVFRVFLKNR